MKQVCEEFGDRIETVWGDSDDAVAIETKECELKTRDEFFPFFFLLFDSDCISLFDI